METYGDLKKIIKTVNTKQLGDKTVGFLQDLALDFLPGISQAKTTFDFIKSAFNKPDSKKTDSWVDKLDVDDEVSAIIDDSVENGFLKLISQTIESEPDDKKLESDFNMNQKMVDYLKQNYKGRTVTGIQENINMKKRFQQLAGIVEQEQQEPEVKVASPIKIIDKDLDDQKSNFKMVNTRDKMIQFLDAMVDNIKQANPDFIESSQFSQAVIAFYNKYK
jgi:hypothetical protein